MKDIADRIKELIEHLQLTNKSFAESIEVAPAIISHVLSGRNNPSLHLIQQITNVYTNVNLAYLLNGEGSLITKQTPNQAHKPKESQSSEEESTSHLPPGARLVSPPSGAPVPPKQQEAPNELSDSASNPETKEAPSSNREPKATSNQLPKKASKSSFTNVYESSGKEIERIVVFYTDRSFREYLPEA